MTRTFLASLATAALAAGGLGLFTGIAHADAGPYQWCPGNNPGGFGGGFTSSADATPNWDWNICHIYYYVDEGRGNVSSTVWEGAGPPPQSNPAP